MVILKFEKTSTAALAAHVDTLRAVTYIFRRAGLEVEYSQGYNPHMELGFSPAIPLGVDSFCEYVSAKTVLCPDILQKLNSVCPHGIRFVKVFEKKVNLASQINRAQFTLYAKGIGNVVEEICSPHYQISYTERGNTVTKEVSDRIFSAKKVDCDTAEVVLATGNSNLRPDRLVCHLMAKHNLVGDYRIEKTCAFVDCENVDDFLARQ